MDPVLQWAITIIVGILTFLAGQALERHKLAQANRLKLLEPIEEWVSLASRLVGIIGDDVSAVASGLIYPTTYNDRDRLENAKALIESKDKVLGILKSQALNTRGTNKISKKLSDLVIQLGISIEQGYVQADVHLLEKINLNQDFTADIMNLVAATSAINILIQEIHGCLALLKVRYT